MVYDFFEELKEIIREFVKKGINVLKYLSVGIAFILWIIIFFKLNPVTPSSSILTNQEIYVFGRSISNWSQWVSFITILYTACWAIYQYKKSVSTKKRDKAGEIAKEFSKSIVDDLGILNLVIHNSKLVEYIPNGELINGNKLKYFTVDEARDIFKKDSIVDEYKNDIKDYGEEIDEIYRLILYYRCVPYSENLLKKYKENKKNKSKNKNKDDIDWIKIENTIKEKFPNMPYHFREFEIKSLNTLEAICLDISTKAADSKFIYQSLHQMFLRNIRDLYMEISAINIDSKDKYYTNIIAVYNEWINMYISKYRKERRLVNKKNEKEANLTR